MYKQKNVRFNNFSISEVAAGIYAVVSYEGSHGMSNAGIIDVGEYTVVFDAFLSPEAAEELKAAAEALTGKQPSYVINSHYHIDHTGGNQTFLSGSRIIGGEMTMRSIRTKNMEMVNYYREKGSDIIEHLHMQLEKATNDEDKNQLKEQLIYAGTITDSNFMLAMPDITFADRLVMQGSKNRMEIVNLYGGHTECDTIAYIPDKKVMFAGDIVFVGRHPWVGAGDPYKLCVILEGLKTYDVDVIIPGHGKPGTRADIGLMIEYINIIEGIAYEIANKKKSIEEIDARHLPAPFNEWKGNKLIPNIRYLMDRYREKSVSDKV